MVHSIARTPSSGTLRAHGVVLIMRPVARLTGHGEDPGPAAPGTAWVQAPAATLPILLSFLTLPLEADLRLMAGVHAVGLATRVMPALAGDAFTEAYLTQPVLLLHVAGGHGTFMASVNLEGLTLRDGELAPGNAGEGWVDKRHPHTWLHELVLTAATRAAGLDVSFTGGRGFAPFGTDDPMVRPFVKYPANHHWSQILERWVAIAALRRGVVTVEAGVFGGAEPDGPDDLGGFDRFADSWAARATLRPRTGLELQGSYAYVESPEYKGGFGLDQRKWNTSARLERGLGGANRIYALVEWGETHEYVDDLKLFIFTTVLAESTLRLNHWTLALRYERTTRPEEERLLDPFRVVRPHTDENIIGATRWNTVTANAGYAFSVRAIRLEPFAEAGASTVREIAGGLFDPAALYGGTTLWSVSLGVRLRAGAQHTRMGRYGVALPAADGAPGHVH
jgi:hypothetical protein